MKTLFLVGYGPGSALYFTPQVSQALGQSQVLCGYTAYMDFITQYFPGKECISTPMTQELERCRLALESAAAGKTTSLVCSGDSGIYGMAGPVLERAEQYPEVDIQILPGITAAISGAAVLGAPLMNDFAVISLSNLLTPWEVIAARLEAAGSGDFVLCLYNPASRKRKENLRMACEQLLRFRKKDTVCGWVRHIGQANQEHKILTLEELRQETVDMFTTVFIGSSTTTCVASRMVTPRGYPLSSS